MPESKSLIKLLEKFERVRPGHLQFLDAVEIGTVVEDSAWDLSIAAKHFMNMFTDHPYYMNLAAFMLTEDHHDVTSKVNSPKHTFSAVTAKLHRRGVVTDKYAEFVTENADFLDSLINYDLDHNLDNYAVMLAKRLYIKNMPDGTPIERYQDVLMREAVWLNMPREHALGDHTEDSSLFLCEEALRSDLKTCLDRISKRFQLLADGKYTHASPTKFNSAKTTPDKKKRAQLASCFLIPSGDTIDATSWTINELRQTLASGGGVGSDAVMRSETEFVDGGPGHAHGVKKFTQEAYHVAMTTNQGARPGSITEYISMLHPDARNLMISAAPLLCTNKDGGCPRLNVGMMFPNIFCEAAMNDQIWYQFQPNWFPQMFELDCEPLKEAYNAAVRDISVLEKMPFNDLSGKALKRACMDVLAITTSFPKLQEVLDHPDHCDYEVRTVINGYLNGYTTMNPREFLLGDFATASRQTGRIFVMYSCNVNKSNMAKNRGRIRHSNLCTEIVQPVRVLHETAVCSISTVNMLCGLYWKDPSTAGLPNYEKTPEIHVMRDHTLDDARVGFSYEELRKVTRVAISDLNRVIDISAAPTEASHWGTVLNRSAGLGFNGFYDLFARMGYQVDSQVAINFARNCVIWMLFAAIDESVMESRSRWQAIRRKCQKDGSVTVRMYKNPDRIRGYENLSDEEYEKTVSAEEREAHEKSPKGNRYGTYEITYNDPADIPKTVGAYPGWSWNGGCARSRGEFHFMRTYNPLSMDDIERFAGKSARTSFETLQSKMMTFGTRNDLFLAPPPTLSTAAVLGTRPSFEVMATNMLRQQSLAGTTPRINPFLAKALESQWNPETAAWVLQQNGSVVGKGPIEMSEKHRMLLRCAYELDQSRRIEMAAAMQPFIDQAISLNRYREEPTAPEIVNDVILAYLQDLKTMYYLKTRAAVNAAGINSGNISDSRFVFANDVASADLSTANIPMEDGDQCVGCG